MAAPIIPQAEATSFSPRSVIHDAALETGADFEFLLRTAARESNFDPDAQARTSSAAGMFQFIEQTWLGMLHRHGDKHGYAEHASAVTRDASGRFTIADAQKREAALALRFDPRAASVMAGELAAENANILSAATGREPTSGELYVAHFLGAQGASDLILTASSEPNARADQLFPAAAAANRSIFFERGVPVTTAKLLTKLTGEAAPVSVPEQVERTRLEGPVKDPSAVNWVRGGGVGYGPFDFGNGELSPALVELLASLKAPERGRSRG